MEQSEAAYAGLRDRLINLVDEHERVDHGGQTCWRERYNAIAYLAHCIGIHSDEIDDSLLLDHMEKYEQFCPDCQRRKRGGT